MSDPTLALNKQTNTPEPAGCGGALVVLWLHEMMKSLVEMVVVRGGFVTLVAIRVSGFSCCLERERGVFGESVLQHHFCFPL